MSTHHEYTQLEAHGPTGGHFIDITGRQSTISKKRWQHSPPDGIAVYPCGCMADEELRLPNAASIMSVSLAQKETKIQNPIWLLLNTYGFHALVKSKNCKSNHRNHQTIQETSVLKPGFSPAPSSTKHHVIQTGDPARAKKWNQYCTKSPKSSISTTQTGHCHQLTWQREQGKRKTQGHAGTCFPLLSPRKSGSSSARHTCKDHANCLWGRWMEQLAPCYGIHSIS